MLGLILCPCLSNIEINVINTKGEIYVYDIYDRKHIQLKMERVLSTIEQKGSYNPVSPH